MEGVAALKIFTENLSGKSKKEINIFARNCANIE